MKIEKSIDEFIHYLYSLGACLDAIEYCETEKFCGVTTAQEAWDNCTRCNWLLWYVITTQGWRQAKKNFESCTGEKLIVALPRPIWVLAVVLTNKYTHWYTEANNQNKPLADIIREYNEAA